MRLDAMPPNTPPSSSPPPSEAPPSSAEAAPGTDFAHTPVLLEEVLAFVPPHPRLIADVTLGGGGHAEAVLRRFPAVELFGCDRDPHAVEAARTRLAPFASRVLIRCIPFSQIYHHLLLESVDFLLADLGVSSAQLDVAARGFSFTRDGPLDMRMDPAAEGATAARLVNGEGAEELAGLFFKFGEERHARRIARAIADARKREPIATTARLAEVVAGAVPARFHRKGHHPATKVFQALRIAVNGELEELERLLSLALNLLRPGGRLALISFHSLEDRPVKTAFTKWERPCECPPKLPLCICGKVSLGKRLTRKPVTAGSPETARNPRARGAKLRVFEKRGTENSGAG